MEKREERGEREERSERGRVKREEGEAIRENMEEKRGRSLSAEASLLKCVH